MQAGTKAGRKVIVSAIGEEGEVIIDKIKAIAEKYDSHEVAKQMKQDLLKMALKVKLLFDENILNEVCAWVCTDV